MNAPSSFVGLVVLGFGALALGACSAETAPGGGSSSGGTSSGGSSSGSSGDDRTNDDGNGSSSGGSSSGGTSSGGTGKAYGAQCKSSSECKSDFCVFRTGGSLGMCTQTCDGDIDCPGLDSQCVSLNDAPQKVCVPK